MILHNNLIYFQLLCLLTPMKNRFCNSYKYNNKFKMMGIFHHKTLEVLYIAMENGKSWNQRNACIHFIYSTYFALFH